MIRRLRFKRMTSRAFGSCDVYAQFNNNVETCDQILIISLFQTVDYHAIIHSYISVNYR